ncbi:glycosyltransferase family 4 protein [Phenylobacterium sp.]|uniref:glycosyltransferase family 4 protein n=1 Tax=Phenylobacterium sp. TaxID=1871053 RepID=UPI0028A18EBB|nr:glycosyltransferase family 4 protein [Phenylobacterium sp.]
MRIAFVSLGSPFNRSSWSGIPYYALRELRRRFNDLTVIDTPRIDEGLRYASSLAAVGVLVSREPVVTRAFARWLDKQLTDADADVVVSIGAAHKVAYIDPKWPVIHVADALFGPLVDYYPKYRLLNGRSRRIGNALQKHLINRNQPILLTSDWAARSAAEYYDVPPSRFGVAPLGANFDIEPAAYERTEQGDKLKLLFVGYDWPRKGGALVLKVFKQLRRHIADAELHIVGCKPSESFGVEGVVHHGHLSKTDPEQAALLESLFRESSFLFMPSQQEAFGLVYCEACAFGLPSIARDTGGVSAIIQHGTNGLLFASEADVDAYVEGIREIWSDGPRYLEMTRAARAAFEDRLRWHVWGATVEAELRSLGRKANGE